MKHLTLSLSIGIVAAEDLVATREIRAWHIVQAVGREFPDVCQLMSPLDGQQQPH